MAMPGSTPGFAQFSSSHGAAPKPTGMDAAVQRNLRGARQGQKPEATLPPVLPGTKGASEPVAPTASIADMSPTEALFDAVNRGDIVAARDAINRGANLDGRNLLGLTPLELSVDLGRNDLSFMLLSMRVEDAASRRYARRAAEPSATEALLTEGYARPSVKRARVAAAPAPARAAYEPVFAAPRLYSGNGGAPIPAAGFLGFNEGRSVR
jgi:hypothetical protein